MRKIITIFTILIMCFSSKAFEIKFSKNVLSTNRPDSVSCSFRLPQEMRTTITAINLYGGQSILLESGKQRSSGKNSFILNSKTPAIKVLASGLYYLILEGIQADGSRFYFDSFQSPWGEMITATDVIYDADSSELSFNLPRLSLVKVRLGLRDGPLLRTFVDWQPLNAGMQKIKWDGLDQSGQVDIRKAFKPIGQVFAVGVPQTAFFVINPDQPITTNGPALYPPDWKQYVLYPPAQVPWPENNDAAINFTVNAITDSSFRITFPPQGENFNTIYSQNNELYITVDDQFICENPQIIVPGEYTIAWKHALKGRHHMLVNFIFDNNRIASAVKVVTF